MFLWFSKVHTHTPCLFIKWFWNLLDGDEDDDEEGRATYIMYWKMIIWARMTKSLNCKSKEPTGRRVSRKRLITFTVWWCYNLANTNTAMQNTFSNTNTKIMRYKTSEGRMWDGKKIFALTNFEFFIQMKYLCICSHWQHVYDLRFF